MQRPVASLMERQPEAAAGGPNPSAGGPGEEAGKIARGLRGTQGDNSHINNLPTYRLGVLETKVDRLQEDVKTLDGRVMNLSERVTEGLTAMCGRISALCERVTGSEQRIEKRLDRLEDRQRSDFRITCRAFLAIGGLILAREFGLIAELMSAVSSLFP